MDLDLSMKQAIVIAAAPFIVVVFLAIMRELFDSTVHVALCVLMVLCIVFAVVMV